MNDEQLMRYSRQMMLPEIDAAGQQRLLDASVLIVGIGGLGSAVSMYLAAAGVGRLTLVDYDRVDLSNLQRQIVHTTERIGELKVESAAKTLAALNPDVIIQTVKDRPDEKKLQQLVAGSDVVVDASDNFNTRFAINAACVKCRVPLVSGAAIRFEAQVSVFNMRNPDCPCYHCLYGEEASTDQSCTANGVIAPLLGIIGSIQACETMKLIMGIGETLEGRLLLLDAMNMEWQSAKLPKDPACPVCGQGADETGKSTVAT